MATTTTNLGLKKPAGTDQALISDINNNMDILDTKIGAVGSTSVQSQINTLNSNIAKQRYSKDYSTSSVTLAQIQSDADALVGNEVGIYDIGYLNGTAATAIGVGIGACFVQLIKHSAQRQMLIFTSITTGEYTIVKKDSSTWSSTFENPIGTLNSKLLVNNGDSLSTHDWKDCPAYAERTYCYEGANTTTYDLPNSNVFVHVMKRGSDRGYAIAYLWSSDTPGIWVNRLHGTWKSWVKIIG